MDDFERNSWNTTGGSALGPSFEELLRSRKADMAKEMNMAYKEGDLLPASSGENFAKKQNQYYNWSGERQPFLNAGPGNYFNDTEESSFKKLSYGDNKVEMKRTVTKIFQY